MTTKETKSVEERIFIFIAYRGDEYGTTPYFSKLFTDHTEMKEFSANHSQEEKHEKRVPNYHSTYLDLTDKSFLTQAINQAREEERVERNHIFDGKEHCKKCGMHALELIKMTPCIKALNNQDKV